MSTGRRSPIPRCGRASQGLWWWGRRAKAAGSSGGKDGEVQSDKEAFQRLKDLAKKHKLDIKGGEVRVRVGCISQVPKAPERCSQKVFRGSACSFGTTMHSQHRRYPTRPRSKAHVAFESPSSSPREQHPTSPIAKPFHRMDRLAIRPSEQTSYTSNTSQPSADEALFTQFRDDILASVQQPLYFGYVAAPLPLRPHIEGHTPISARVGTEATDCRRRLHAHKQRRRPRGGEERGEHIQWLCSSAGLRSSCWEKCGCLEPSGEVVL